MSDQPRKQVSLMSKGLRIAACATFLTWTMSAHAQQANVETKVQTKVETKVIVNTTVNGVAQTSGNVDITKDEVQFSSVGNAKLEKEAAIESYYTGFNKVLRSLAGAQAEDEIGKKFREDMERDFDGFRKRYFTSDTGHICKALDKDKQIINDKDKAKKPVSEFTCRADGMIKMLAVRTEFTKVMKSKERTLSNQLTFVVSAAGVSDPKGPYVVDKLREAFTSAGFRVLSQSAAEEEIGKCIESRKNCKIDFSLGIKAIEYSTPDFDSAEQRMRGTITVRFDLNDVKGQTQVTSVPVSINLTVSGPKTDSVKNELQERLANAAATEIGRKTSASVVSFQVNRDDDDAAASRAKTGERQYMLRIVGITQSDRKKIAMWRKAIRDALPDSTPEVSSSESNDTRVTIMFSTAEKLQPDDVIDKLFEANDQSDKLKSFDAKYESSSRTFTVTF